MRFRRSEFRLTDTTLSNTWTHTHTHIARQSASISDRPTQTLRFTHSQRQSHTIRNSQSLTHTLTPTPRHTPTHPQTHGFLVPTVRTGSSVVTWARFVGIIFVIYAFVSRSFIPLFLGLYMCVLCVWLLVFRG